LLKALVIRRRIQRNPAMTGSPAATGFESRTAHTASSRLHELVAAALAIGALSLCTIVTLTVFSIKVSMALPVPA
jgi:hypothetical protein